MRIWERHDTARTKRFAIVTGASSGIGYELAKRCAASGFDLLIAADWPETDQAAQDFRRLDVSVDTLEGDLATVEGVDQLYAAARGRPVDALLANAGHGLGRGFLDAEFARVRHLIDANIAGTIYLIQKAGRDLRARGQGRVVITESIAGFMPRAFPAFSNGSKAFLNSVSFALRNELKDTGVTVTCLIPGATETDFFEHAGVMDTKVGQQEKDDPASVAQVGFEVLMNGDGHVVWGWKNKLQTTIADVTPASLLAERHRNEAEPGTANRK